MNLLIAPIDKHGTRKVGVKVTGANSGFISLFKSFAWEDRDTPFGYFFHFCGELRNSLNGTEYTSIELTDGYDIQDKNVFIDYSHSPPKVTVEDKEGFPTELETGRKTITYIRKSDGQKFKYLIVEEKKRDEKYLHCMVEKDGRKEPRRFLVENIVSEIEV